MTRSWWMTAAAAAVALAGCASAGGGLFPEAGDAPSAIAGAERMISEAQQAGADSLARDAMTSARNNLAAARATEAALRGQWRQVFVGLVVTVAPAGALAGFGLLVPGPTIVGSLRVGEQQEREGLDISEHEELGYDW